MVEVLTILGNSGTVFMINSIISVHQGTFNFTNNHVNFNDASTILVVFMSSFYLNGEMTFFNNSGTNTGLFLVLSSASIYGNVNIVNNEAELMAGWNIDNSTLYMEGALVIRNNKLSRSSILSVSSSHVYLNCTVDIFQNTAYLKLDDFFPSIISVQYSEIYFFQRFEAFGNSGPYSCFGLVNSNFTSYGKWFWESNNCLDSSYYSFYSTCLFFGNVTFSNNFAETLSGGAITLVSSTMKLQGNSTFSKNRSPTADGGAIHTIRSKLIFSGNITFKENTALRGGAINLYHQSILVLQPDLVSLVFEKNQAQKGGAIHVDDLVSYINCTNQRTIQKFYSERPTCFFEAYMYGIQNKITFQGNLAILRGSALFGGMLDRCVLVSNVVNTTSTPLEIFLDITDIELNNSKIPKISSESFRLCLCQNGQPNCSIRESSLQAKRGETFSLSVTAFDQLNSSVEAVIRSYLRSDFDDRHQRLGDGGSQQIINNMCTNVSYRVWSSSLTETVILYVEGPCKDEGNGSYSIQINFTDCPLGFDLNFDICSCDQRLVQYTNTCDINSETIERSTNFWIGASYTDNGSYSGLILYPNCPFAYCKWPSRVDLTSPETQCNYNRSGILCGRCGGNSSLLLGTSKCSKCSDFYLFLLIPFTVAGIVLVVCLFLLRLTVAEGFLHGLIFYVNIITSNHSLFVPDGTFKGFSIFLAWLNLDWGIETCFYDGMDQLSMVWLQFVFPFYLLAIVFLIIIVSHYSIRISRLFGNNPVSVLATIIFLSYTKIVRNILVIFSYATVEYPNQLLIKVWLFDGNVNYLQGQHIGLFAFAVLITTFLLMPFTLVLISAQLMMKSQRISSSSVFLKVKPFIDAYHAPYKPSQRYWTGLFLFLRCMILLTFALNALGDSSINLLVITTVCLGVCTLSWISGGVYTNAHLEVIEAISILNLGVFAAATYHVQLTGGNQATVANVSITVALLVFLWIVISRIAYRFELKRKLNILLKRAEDGTDNLQIAAYVTAQGRPERAISSQTVPAPVERHVNIFDNIELRESLLA